MNQEPTYYDVIVIGGGAAGFFAAINLAEARPDLSIAILERGLQVLSKVKVSGGGRCNVTHAEFVPAQLAQNYPRGKRELLGPFHSFMTGDTIEWFRKRGIALKIEEDGRMFPTTDSSQTIIDCFTSLTSKLGISVLLQQSVVKITRGEHWRLQTKKTSFTANKLILATGSNPKIWSLLEGLGHSIEPPVASLFTFNINDKRLKGLQGTSMQTRVEVLNEKGKKVLESEGPTLITHWGLSGPAILKLSAWGARDLAAMDYRFNIRVNWLYDLNQEEALQVLEDQKQKSSIKKVSNTPCFGLTRRFWQSQLEALAMNQITWADCNKKQLRALSDSLVSAGFKVTGKSTFKEEFVTAGGVILKEVNFKTFESKICKDLYLAGEVLNIDAITGGFNFQNAWTGAYMAAKSIANE